MRFETKDSLKEAIHRAFEIDALLPKTAPFMSQNSLGSMIQIPDNERSPQDVLEDMARARVMVMAEDIKLWFYITTDLLPVLSPIQRAIVIMRAKNKGWKRIAKALVDLKIAERHLYRTTLWRIYNGALKELLKENQRDI